MSGSLVRNYRWAIWHFGNSILSKCLPVLAARTQKQIPLNLAWSSASGAWSLFFGTYGTWNLTSKFYKIVGEKFIVRFEGWTLAVSTEKRLLSLKLTKPIEFAFWSKKPNLFFFLSKRHKGHSDKVNYFSSQTQTKDWAPNQSAKLLSNHES